MLVELAVYFHILAKCIHFKNMSGLKMRNLHIYSAYRFKKRKVSQHGDTNRMGWGLNEL